LVGTVIGFILMLSPIAEMESFESNNIRNLLTAMSSGMAVALFTTLTGLITSTLLKVQYFLADSAVVQIIDTLTTCENRHDDDASPNA
jgi:biopolymer transport protein ExbB/TolQ